ncbi:MAG: HAD family phosphatase [Bacteroidetes bacterium]|nr:HAD family phosphatase [Bacteroidota bacterium]
MTYKGFIFDLDGVLVDSSKIHYAGWKRFLNSHDKDFEYETFLRDYFGKRGQETLEQVFGKGRFSAEEAKKISDDIDSNFVSKIAEFGMPVRGALGFVNALKESGEKIALATSAPRQNVDAFLDAFSLRGIFDAEVCADDVSRGKPDPEVFLKAASLLREGAPDCVVFEDSMFGVSAAKASGATCVALLTTTTREVLRKADYFISDFADEGLNGIIRLKTKEKK